MRKIVSKVKELFKDKTDATIIIGILIGLIAIAVWFLFMVTPELRKIFALYIHYSNKKAGMDFFATYFSGVSAFIYLASFVASSLSVMATFYLIWITKKQYGRDNDAKDTSTIRDELRESKKSVIETIESIKPINVSIIAKGRNCFDILFGSTLEMFLGVDERPIENAIQFMNELSKINGELFLIKDMSQGCSEQSMRIIKIFLNGYPFNYVLNMNQSVYLALNCIRNIEAEKPKMYHDMFGNQFQEISTVLEWSNMIKGNIKPAQ